MIEKNNIYCESCLDTIARMEKDSVHAVVTSPPYFVGKEYEEQYKTPEKYTEYVRFLVDVFRKIYPVLMPGGHLWINIDDAHTSLKSEYRKSVVLPTHAVLITELCTLYDYKEMVLWRKIRGKHASGGAQRLLGSYGRFRSPGSIPIVQEVEYVLWFKKPGKRDDVTDEMRKASALSNDEFKKYGMQIWDDVLPESSKKIGHPAPYPVELPARIIKLSTFRGDIVYDPFMGSGTTALACLSTGRNYIGSEINADYVQLANERISTKYL